MKCQVIIIVFIFGLLNNINSQEIYHLKSFKITGYEKQNFDDTYQRVILDKEAKTFTIGDGNISYKIKSWDLVGSTGVNKIYVGVVEDSDYEFSIRQTLSVTGNFCNFFLESFDKLVAMSIECYAKPYESNIRFEFTDQFFSYFYFIKGTSFDGTPLIVPNDDHIILDLRERKFYSQSIKNINYKILSRKLRSDDKMNKIFEGLMGRQGKKYRYIQECNKETGQINFFITRDDEKLKTFILSEVSIFDTSENAISNELGYGEDILFSEPPIYTGTGFFISSDGLVATNNHIIENSGSISIIVNHSTGHKEYKAILLKSDILNDIAILKIDDKSFKALGALPYGFSDTIEVGEQVFTIGYPFSDIMGVNSKLSTGIVNSTTGIVDDERYIQISIPLQNGNSGGPLIDERGNIIGITSAKLSGKNLGLEIENVNYAIKTKYLSNLIESLKLPMLKASDKVDLSIKKQVQIIKPFVCIIKAE